MIEKPEAQRRGRPAKPVGEKKRGNLTFRTRDALREKLEAAASQSGRSISEEIEHRLDRSFAETDLLKSYFGSEDAIDLLKVISLIVNYQMARTGKSWRNDKATRDAIMREIFGSFFELNNDEGSVKKQTAYEKFVENTSENLSNSSEMFRLMLDHDFSDLEKQVLYYMVKKYSNKEIARKLNIDESLVKTYVQRIFQRLNVRNRAEAATWARKNLKIAS